MIEKTHIQVKPDVFVPISSVVHTDYNNQTLTVLLKNGDKHFIRDPRRRIINTFRHHAPKA
ncbi:hypothetical protein KFZ76_11960 [Methylovulum psychrotolerans]|uniref:hypothetical protein n=1 Tax=Methylovulum psychrotolerans TaxID=1704499 RepID=UPI001BFFD1B6|nr:hypothetical protein [Methylovulum psychrotolerans]MBT9098422.1 hypothetical protein [Methylovulum psychrotolerans]